MNDAGAILSRVRGGAGLVDPLDPVGGADGLIELARRALGEAGAVGRADGMCCGLAGAGRRDAREALRARILEAGVARSISVIGDAEPAMYDAFGANAGVLLIAGTGSVAWARSASGRSVRSGGWGTLLGDEGSGYAIGLAGLRAVVRAADGREVNTTLSRVVLAATRCAVPEDLIAWTAAASKAEVASIAPVVLGEADRGDLAAGAIAEEAARELAEQVEAVVAGSGQQDTRIPIAFAGGLISPGGPLRGTMERALEMLDAIFMLRAEAVDAARGAAAIAALGAKGGASPYG
jgi:N-acetylglucosamine kinase-like BadF-type ATPase